MANPDHINRLMKSKESWDIVKNWNRWRQTEFFTSPDLSKADLTGLFAHRVLFGAPPIKIDFSNTNFQGSNLTGANLWGCDLSYSNFRSANLRDVILWGTVLGSCDFSSAKNLEHCIHHGQSIIDFRTIEMSWPLALAFLRGVGLSDAFIEHIPNLIETNVRYPSCFISYSSAEEDFAKRLHRDLQDNGVRSWFAPHDMRIGDRIRQTIEKAIKEHDRLLIVLSDSSIKSGWVKKEIETGFDEEQKRGEVLLFPIRIDDVVMKTCESWAADIRRTRHIGNFSLWEDTGHYSEAFARLLRDLALPVM